MTPTTLAEVITLLRSLPAGTSLPAAGVLAWLVGLQDAGAATERPSAGTVAVDLTVQAVAELFERGPSTVRGWIAAGEFPSAYQFHGKEWRVPVADVEAMQRRQSEQFKAARQPAPRDDGPADLGAWRSHLKAG